ncbi:hypothetical protein KC19_5G188300 [Ceratodon purpureus]|uniref:Uncharacterized protein n=1 Tax=Ceratodon purpureus TaxID=3225 RepID=A0A8T0I5S8_CERPU|nr:hypothetical protein KC19_5G188300 [Ceratodon purpureus]
MISEICTRKKCHTSRLQFSCMSHRRASINHEPTARNPDFQEVLKEGTHAHDHLSVLNLKLKFSEPSYVNYKIIQNQKMLFGTAITIDWKREKQSYDMRAKAMDNARIC